MMLGTKGKLCENIMIKQLLKKNLIEACLLFIFVQSSNLHTYCTAIAKKLITFSMVQYINSNGNKHLQKIANINENVICWDNL